MLKSDMHMHAIGDPEDTFITHTPEQLIDLASSLSFDVLSISCHGKVLFDKKLARYAWKKGILLISGAEAFIEGKHVLIYNISQSELENTKTFDDLRALRKKRNDVLVIAPHPYYPMSDCLHEKLDENIDVFDAIEISHMYFWFFDFNQQAVKAAEKYGKTLVALSDTHHLWMFGKNYTLVDSRKSVGEYFAAIRAGKVRAVHSSLSFFTFVRELFWIAGSEISRVFSHTTRK
jgi:predicted metal-dependent phosphoesterase TrpH